ncbi:MAG: flippase [Leptolyngbya foveolarum]|uniref:Flippase n=1 Tax=Leptolyngbya foveolarum TaxID=47253 RepID=A0A2W4U052_9CYAN|nr:MAG: flippase [Leptolyngbya foveolarum]
MLCPADCHVTYASTTDRMKSKIAGVFGLRLTYSALTFLTSILLARVLGQSGFGIYTYSIVWAYLLSVPATMGFDNFVVKQIAVYQTQASWRLMNGLLKWANRTVILSSTSVALLAILVASVLRDGTQSETFLGFCIAMLLMPALSLRNVRRGAMRGLNNVAQGLLPELLFDPLILIIFTVGAYVVVGDALTPLWVIIFYGIGSGITLLIVSRFLKQTLPNEVVEAKPAYEGRFWLSAAIPFMLLESVPIINSQVDVLMLGAFKGATAVGLYVPVNRGAQLITFILMAVGSSLSPVIASKYADGKMADLQQTITSSVRVVAGVAFLFAATLIVFSSFYLSLFGPEFLAGQDALYIFCTGNFIATSMGLSYGALNMTGHEREAATIGWGATISNIILNAVLIPLWGVNGAALATSLGSATGALISLIMVKKTLNLDMTIIGPLNKASARSDS